MNTAPSSGLVGRTGWTRWSYRAGYHGPCPPTTARGYNGPDTPSLGAAPISENRAAPDDLLGESTNLRLVRLRLFLALVIMFAIPVVIATPVIYGLAVGFKTSLIV